jgi:hypothetical protein
LGVKNATPELKYRLGEENKIMRVSKRVMITAGSFLLAAALGFVLFPNAAHGIVAALVQVTNTAANPVPISDITKSPAQIVNLNCDQADAVIGSLLICAPIDPATGVESSPFTVPAGQHFVITSIELNPTGSQPGVIFYEVGSLGLVGRAGMSVLAGSVLQLRYTGAGLVFGPGTQFGFSGINSTPTGYPEDQITVEGYLTAN